MIIIAFLIGALIGLIVASFFVRKAFDIGYNWAERWDKRHSPRLSDPARERYDRGE